MDRPIRVPLYAVIVSVFCIVGSPVLAVIASVQIAERNAARQLAAVRAERCEEYAGLIGILEPVGPRLTTAGNGLLAYYKAEYVANGCKPDN